MKWFDISYNNQEMLFHIKIGKYDRFFQCPFGTWWKARKWFKKPKFKWYFGPTHKFKGHIVSQFGEYDDYEQKGIWPFASTEYLKWNVSKWFPISIFSDDINWKDKWNTPRYERPGYFIIFFGRDYHKCWQLSLSVSAPEIYCNNDCTEIDIDENYWESILWYLYYGKEYGATSYDKKDRDIIKARNTANKSHWSKHKNININNVKQTKLDKELISIGDDVKEYCYIDVESEQLYNILTDNLFNFVNLISNVDLSVSFSIKDTNKNIWFKFIYIKHIKDNKFRLYFNEISNKQNIYNLLFNNKDIKLEYNYSQYIDLGPSFKDDILTDKAIKLIRESK